jgi:hypothetical protein
MEYKHQVKDFVARTKANLELIEQSALAGQEGYEITQLVNSLLGLLVFPQQYYFNQIPALTMSEMKEAGWPEIKVDGEFEQHQNLRDLMRYLRNAIAHFNIKFLGDDTHKLRALRVWNHRGSNQITWRAEIPFEDLRLIVTKFLALILEENKTNPSTEPQAE